MTTAGFIGSGPIGSAIARLAIAAGHQVVLSNSRGPETLADLAGGLRRGFGSLRVRATIGSSTWTTSIFPGRAGYVLPVKRSIRVAQALDVGDTATVTVELIDFA